jgi:general secretion pathway protein G
MDGRIRRQTGFTLFELMAVLAILGILAAIAVPSYKYYLTRANEAVLREDLHQMRKAIDDFYADKMRYPENLEELATEHYLRHIPEDPFTRSRETWITVSPEAREDGDLPDGLVFDVHSGSKGSAFNGTPYSEW